MNVKACRVDIARLAYVLEPVMIPTLHRRALLQGAVAFAALAARPAFAEAPILTVSGAVADGASRSFTLADLEAQPRIAFTTKTPWHAGPTAFEGIGIDRFLDLVGAKGTKLRLIALNDYMAEIEIADIKGLGGILAYREDGNVMPISDKGPLFVVFPFDSDERLQQQSVYARCVWQLTTIEIF